MALWLFRAGSRGEYEKKFLVDGRVYITWTGLKADLSKLKSREHLLDLLATTYPDFGKGKLRNYAAQIHPAVTTMKPGDWIVLPSKLKPAAIHIAEITGPYEYDAKADDPFYHSRRVKWIATNVPRSVFDQDLLYSFGAFMTICRISRNDAERRVRALAGAGWRVGGVSVRDMSDDDVQDDGVDYERLAKDQIAKLITQKFKGHRLAHLVGAILRAQGYTVFVSSEGPDNGIDILAAPGALGFGTPRICVQVKSGDAPVDVPTLNQLIGAMQNVKADQGLLVSWGGFKASVDKQVPAQFFKVRLWDQEALLDELLTHYERLDEELRTEFALKRIWAIAATEDDARS